MRIIKKVVFDPFVCEYAWTCESCTSELEAEQSDINALNDGETTKLYVACPVCSYTHYVDDKKMSVEASSRAIASAAPFVDFRAQEEAAKSAQLEEASGKIMEDIRAAAEAAGVDPQSIIDGLSG